MIIHYLSFDTFNKSFLSEKETSFLIIIHSILKNTPTPNNLFIKLLNSILIMKIILLQAHLKETNEQMLF